MSINKKQIFFYAPTKTDVLKASNKFINLLGKECSPLILYVKKMKNEWVSQVNYFS